MAETQTDAKRIEKLIVDDLKMLGSGIGLKDLRFGSTNLIQSCLLPGDRRQQAALYHRLVIRNIEFVEDERCREALVARLNLLPNYPDKVRDRLALVARRRSLTVQGDGRNRRTSDLATEGTVYLATLICEEIEQRNLQESWNELLHSNENVASLAPALCEASDTDVDEEPINEQPAELSPSLVVNPHYVHRKRLEEQFKKLIEEGAKLVVLYGQPGMGKTVLAEQLTKDNITGLPAPFIRIDQGSVSATDIQAAYSALEISLAELASQDPAIQFAALVCGQSAPPFVVLDNLNSSDELRELLPRNTRSTVVATCRRQGDSNVKADFIEVGKMSRSEASELLRNHIEGIAERDARHVASQFGDYPLLLRYASGIYRQQARPIREFCHELTADAISISQDAHTEEGSTLLVVIRRMMSTIRARDILAFELLVCCSFIDDTPSFCVPFLVRYLGTFTSGIVAEARLAQALRVLQGFGLLNSTRSGSWQRARIHPFTLEVLRADFEDKLPEITSRFETVASMEGENISSFFEAIRQRKDGAAIFLGCDTDGLPMVMTYTFQSGWRQLHLSGINPSQPSRPRCGYDQTMPPHYRIDHYFNKSLTDDEVVDSVKHFLDYEVHGREPDLSREWSLDIEGMTEEERNLFLEESYELREEYFRRHPEVLEEVLKMMHGNSG